MDSKVLAPVLAGIGIGWLAFSKEGQAMAKGLGQSIMPALTGGGGGGGGGNLEPAPKKDDDDEKKSKSDKEDDD